MAAIINIQTGEIIGEIHPWDQFTEARRDQIPWSSAIAGEAVEEANKIAAEHYNGSEAFKEYVDAHTFQTEEELEKCNSYIRWHLIMDIMFIKMKEWQSPVLDEDVIEDFYAFAKDFKNTIVYRNWKDGNKIFAEAIKQHPIQK